MLCLKINSNVVRFFFGIFIGITFTYLYQNSKPEEKQCKPLEVQDLLEVAKVAKDDNERKKIALLSAPAIEKKLVFIGVMTTKDFINTRAKALYETWGKDLQGQLMFFTSEHTDDTIEGFPVVRLPGVDDTYPPQKKSFTMLKYMHDNFLEQYHFFMRVDDDLHVRTDKLIDFLNSVYAKEKLLLGQPGAGTKKEKGKLGLAKGEKFCMGGPGIVFNAPLLLELSPYLEQCMLNFFTGHEDVELWRCVKKYTGIDCTKQFEWGEVFYHNQDLEKVMTRGVQYKDVHTAVTLHPLKIPHHQFELYKLLQGIIIQEKETEILKIMKQLNELTTSLGYADNSAEGVFYSYFDLKVKRDQSSFMNYNLLYGSVLYNIQNITSSGYASPFYDVVNDLCSIILNRIHKPQGRRYASMSSRNVPGLRMDINLHVRYRTRKTSSAKRLASSRSRSSAMVINENFDHFYVNYGLLWMREIETKI